MACDCLNKANEKLAEFNTRIPTRMVLIGNGMQAAWPIETERIKNGRSDSPAMGLSATYCPLCGKKLRD